MRDLLEEIVKISGCEYISDLPECRNPEMISVYLLSEQVNAYGLEELERVIQYIYKTEQSFTSRDQIEKFLKHK